MKILLLAVGKTSTEYIAKAVDNYSSRILHYIPFSFKALSDVKLPKNSSQEQQKSADCGKFHYQACTEGGYR